MAIGQDAACHRHEMRIEDDRTRPAILGEHLTDLAQMGMGISQPCKERRCFRIR